MNCDLKATEKRIKESEFKSAFYFRHLSHLKNTEIRSFRSHFSKHLYVEFIPQCKGNMSKISQKKTVKISQN